MHEIPNPHPPAAPAAPSAASGAREEGGVSALSTPLSPMAACHPLTRSRATEIVALDLLTGNHAQIMDMLGRDPEGAPDDAWERAAELLIESMHGCVTVITARRNRSEANTLRPLVSATIRPEETLAQYAARAFGYPA